MQSPPFWDCCGQQGERQRGQTRLLLKVNLCHDVHNDRVGDDDHDGDRIDNDGGDGNDENDVGDGDIL